MAETPLTRQCWRCRGTGECEAAPGQGDLISCVDCEGTGRRNVSRIDLEPLYNAIKADLTTLYQEIKDDLTAHHQAIMNKLNE